MSQAHTNVAICATAQTVAWVSNSAAMQAITSGYRNWHKPGQTHLHPILHTCEGIQQQTVVGQQASQLFS